MVNKIFFFALLILLAACGKSGKFTITGSITEATGQMLYLEKAGLLKDSLIDSVKLTQEGTFRFRVHSPQYPELYRLKVNRQMLILCIDSLETVQIQGSAGNLLSASVTGSTQTEDIQKLRKSAIELQNQFEAIVTEKEDVKSQSLADFFRVNLEKHKKTAQELILTNPGSMASYFALYQQVGDRYIFSPYIKSDMPYYQAVATTFHTFMPNYERSKNLYNLVLGAIKEDRIARQGASWENLASVKSLGFIEIALKNINGYPQKLSSLIGNPILLDFSAYGVETSIDHTFTLREIYNKYSSKGLQIYQVSLDESKTLWEHAVSKIPWTCVYDETGATARAYNVREIPTLYLISKDGTITGRYNSAKKAETDLSKAF